jgi:hypothetical protein
MQSQALAMDWIFQPARWWPAGWLAEWLRHRAARQLERRQAARQRVVNLAAHYCWARSVQGEPLFLRLRRWFYEH